LAPAESSKLSADYADI